MIKLYMYEFKRILFSKFFLGILVVTFVYSYYSLNSEVILGAGYTAPFSAWTYGWYLSGVMPVLLIALLFFVSFMFTKKEKNARLLFNATPVDPLQYVLMRCMAAVSAYALLLTISVLISFIFYATIFKFTAFSNFILPLVIVVIPSLLLITGLGIVAGNYHIGAIYVTILLLLAISQLSFLSWPDLFGSIYFSEYPKTLSVEPSFSISARFALERLAYALVGCGLIILGVRKSAK